MAWYRCVGGAGGSLKLRTASGRIATFSTNMVEAFKSLKSEINPVQDLHGYTKPWSGGGGKNKLENTSTVATLYGVTFSKNDDGSVKLTGTSTGSGTGTYIGFFTLPSGTYIFTDDSTSTNYYMFLMVEGDGTWYKNGMSFTVDGNTRTRVVMYIASGTATNTTLYPMIRLASVQDASFEPYSNICPISGFSNSVISRCGKNLVDNSHFTYGLPSTTVGADINTIITSTRYSYFGFVSPKTNCIISTITDDSTKYGALLLFGYKNGVLKEYTFWSVATTLKTFSIDLSEFDYCRIGLGGNSGVTTYDDLTGHGFVQLELGNTATAYEPYAGSKYQEYFKGLMNGTYGVVELGSLNWQKNGTNRFTSINQPDNIKAPSSQSEYAKIACPNYQTSNFSTVYSESTDKIVAINTNKAINIVDKAYDDATAFKNALSGVYLIYELATATTPTITQAEINTLISAFGADLNAIKFGTTVYGGEVDLTNERVNVSRKIVDLSTLSWVYATSAKRWEALKADMKNYPSRSADIIFEKYETDITATAGSEGKGFISALVIYVTSNDSTTPPSGNACYPLATPTEIPFEAEPIKPLVGVNNIYGDTNGDTEVKYLYRE